MSEEITLKFYHKVKKNKTGDVYSLFVTYVKKVVCVVMFVYV